MSKVHGKETKVLANEFDLSSYLNNTDMTWDVDTPESTVYGSDDRTYVTGLRSGSMSFSGFWDASSSLAIDEVIPPDMGATAAVLVSYGPDGLTHGDIVYSVQSRHTNYSIGSPVDGIATVTLDVQGTDRLSRGVSLHDLTAVVSSAGHTAYNLGANTSGGGIAYLHVTAITLASTESLVVAVQDSATSTAGSWTDLIAFTAITCSEPTAERKTVTGNVDQYVRSEWEFLTSSDNANTATFTVAFQQL